MGGEIAPHLGIRLQHRRDQVPRIARDLALGEAVLVRENPAVCALDVRALVRGLTHEHRKANDPHAPHVNLEGVPALLLAPLDDLRRDVVGGAAYRAALLVRRVDPARQAEVADLNVHGFAQEEVPELQVAVDDVAVVHEGDGVDDLQHEEARLLLRERLAPLDHLVHALIVAQLKEDVAVGLVLEEVFVLANVGMLHRSVYLYFRLQLRIRPDESEGRREIDGMNIYIE